MRVSRTHMMSVLNTNVVEALFIRRHQKRGHPIQRRALITNCNSLLNSPMGREILNFHPPKGYGQKYNIATKNLVLTWDLFWQDYRTFSADQGIEVVTQIPVATNDQQDEWWKYFYDNIAEMPQDTRMAFMDR